MKKILQKSTLLLMGLVLSMASAQAQTFVTVDGTLPWNGYMNVFDVLGNYQFGNPWALPDLKSTVDPGTNTVTVQPNFNAYGDAVASGNPGALAYWTNGAGDGNKYMEANTYIESTTIPVGAMDFTGTVDANTLSLDYEAFAFIKVLDPAMGFATVINQTVLLPTSGPFAVSAIIPPGSGLIVQYGFAMVGLNANPANEAALGSVVIGPGSPLSACVTNLNATFVNDAVALNWNNCAQQDLINYTIEKSIDRVNFVALTDVAASQTAQTTYIDSKVNTGEVAYYRVVSNFTNGTKTTSEIARVLLPTSAVSVVPTSASNSITIISQAKKIQLASIYAANGALVRNVVVASSAQAVDISSLPNGTYYITMPNTATLHFVKQ